jgi:hypothetical protein
MVCGPHSAVATVARRWARLAISALPGKSVHALASVATVAGRWSGIAKPGGFAVNPRSGEGSLQTTDHRLQTTDH